MSVSAVRALCHFVRLQGVRSVSYRLMTCPSLLTPQESYPQRKLISTVNREVCIQTKRYYAKKGRDKQTGKAKGKHKMQLSDDEADEVIDFSNGVRHQMELAVEHMKQEYISHLTLRTSAGALDKLMVETKDGRFQLNQLAQIVQKNPQMIVINLATSPQYMPNVKEAISKSGMNLNPQQDGSSLFVSVPKVTREHREGLSKSAKTICDKTKTRLRDLQNKNVKSLNQQKSLHSEDLILSVKDLIQSTTQSYADEADKIMQAKQKELLGTK